MGFDKGFELDVLAGCVGDGDYRRTVKRIIGDEEVWSTDANGILWETIKGLGQEDRLTGAIVGRVVSKVESEDLAEAVVAVSEKVFSRAASPRHKGYARSELRDWVRTARARRIMGQAVKELKKGDVDTAEELLTSIRTSSDLATPYELSSWFDTFETRQRERLERKHDPSRFPSIKTRFPSLDDALNGGLRLTQIGLVVAHTGRGKSGLTNHLAFTSAAGGDLTIEISTEMGKELVDTRLDALFHGFPIGDFIRARFTKREQDKFFDKIDRLEKRLSKKLWTCSVPVLTLTPSMIEDIIDDVEQETGEKVRMLILDSPDHMRKNPRIKEERHQQAANYWAIKEIVDKRTLAMWATTQAPQALLGKLITAEGTAESYDKARIADVILTLNQTEAERRAEIIRGYLAKNRMGEAGRMIWFQSDWSRMHVEEIAAPTPAAAAA